MLKPELVLQQVQQLLLLLLEQRAQQQEQPRLEQVQERQEERLPFLGRELLQQGQSVLQDLLEAL